MTFTDDDLKQLKYQIEINTIWIEVNLDVLESLLARLEAAERIVYRPCANECGNCFCKVNRDIWRKAAEK